jgi:pyrroloquinoline-quinone synthase
MAGALPASRFATEAYVRFVAEHSNLEAIASSLTELFAPQIHRERISGMLESYDFIGENVMQYFRKRLTQAPRDVEFALDYVRREARIPEQRQAVVDALIFKCNVLWTQLDALYFAYVEPGLVPPGAFVPKAAP